MLATVSFLPALIVVLRVTASDCRFNWPLSARSSETSASTFDERGTISTEPALINMRGGMVLIARRSASLMPVRLAASVELMFAGTFQAVQLAYWPTV